MKEPVFSVVIPVFNEEEVIMTSHKRIEAVMRVIGEPYELIFVNDGSSDETQNLLERICRENENAKAIMFSRNFGHQLAVTAGLDAAAGKAVIIIDADMQDPPEVIPGMIEKWREGCEVVYGKRVKREKETFLKKFTAKMFYRFLRFMSKQPLPLDSGDFRLVDRKVAKTVCAMREHGRYLRGMFAWAGFKQCPYEFERDARLAGETKYTLSKMIRLATDAIVGFSTRPFNIIMGLGIFTGMISFLAVVVFAVLWGCGLPGMWSILLLFGFVFLLFSLTLFAIGLLGVYLGRVQSDVQNRPLYIVSKRVGFEQ